GTMLVATAPGAARMPSHAARPASAISNGVTVPRPTRKSVEVRREHWFVAPVREPEKAILLVNRPLRDSFAAPSVEGAIVSGSAMRSSDWSSVASEQTRPIRGAQDRKSTRLNSSHVAISYAVFCMKKKIQVDQA